MAGSADDQSPLSDSDFDLGEGLGAESDNAALRALIAGEIRSRGPITFHRFMELALYHPTEGYYTSSRQRIGRSGDYVTSPEISPRFGYAIARQVAELWRCLGSPPAFPVAEYGAGSGRLAADLLRWLAERDPDCSQALTYTLVEISPALRVQQAEVLSQQIRVGKVRIAADAGGASESRCVIANELLDSFPVHRVQVQDGALKEVYVALDAGQFIEVAGEPSTPALLAYFKRLGVLPAEHCTAEVNLEMRPWLSKTANSFSNGYLLILDYGYEARRLYASWRQTGTLLCYHRQTVTDDPYQFIGRQDMTSHIDFTSLALDAEAAGLNLLGYTDQSRFLTALGVTTSLQSPKAGGRAVQEYYARRRATEALTDPSGLGRIRVVLLGKHAPSCNPLGFAEQLPAPV